MDFLGIGPLELIIVFIIILLVLGPNEMVKAGKTIGEIIRKINQSDEWKGLNRISRELRTLPNRMAREAEFEKLKKEIELNNQITPISGELTESATVEFNEKIKSIKKNNKPHEPEETSSSSNQLEK